MGTARSGRLHEGRGGKKDIDLLEGGKVDLQRKITGKEGGTMDTWYMALRQGEEWDGCEHWTVVVASRYISEVAWAVVVRKTSQVQMTDATRVGTMGGEGRIIR